MKVPLLLSGLALLLPATRAFATESPADTVARMASQHKALDATANQRLDAITKQYEAALRDQAAGVPDADVRAADALTQANQVIGDNMRDHNKLSDMQRKEGHDLFVQQVEQARADADGTPLRGSWASLDYVAEAVKKFVFGKQPEKPPPFPLPSGGPATLARDPHRHTDPTKAKPKALEAGVSATPGGGGGGGGGGSSSEVVVSGTETKGEVTFSGKKDGSKKSLREQVLEEVRKKLGIKGPINLSPSGTGTSGH